MVQSLRGPILLISMVALFLPGGRLEGQVDLGKLSARAELSQIRLATAPARWTVKARTASGAQFGIRVVSAPPDFEARILLKPDSPKPEPFARIVSSGGKWYVEEIGGLKGVYLPWQAPFSFEVVALLLSQAWPPPYHQADLHVSSRLIKETIVVRAPLTKKQKALARSFLEDARNLTVKPGSELERNLRAIRLRVEKGNQLQVDGRTGLMEKLHLGNIELEWGRVEWLGEKPEIPSLNSYPDFSAPLPKERENLIMIGHAGAWRPGYPDMDAGGQLLNLDNGKLLRIPFVGASCMPGCFVDQRTKVAVTAREADGSGVGLYLVKLSTGKSVRLGGESFAGGVCEGPVLSPDGKTLAVTHSARILTRQLYLLDFKGGEPRAIGKPIDARSFSWLGDGSGLIGIVQHSGPDTDGASELRMARFGLDGSVTEIRKDIGKFAVVVGEKGDRILFQLKKGGWATCGLSGNDVKLLPKRLEKMSFPSVSPDGKRVVMLERDSEQRSRPVVLDLTSGKVEPVNADPGRWILPAWR